MSDHWASSSHTSILRTGSGAIGDTSPNGRGHIGVVYNGRGLLSVRAWDGDISNRFSLKALIMALSSRLP